MTVIFESEWDARGTRLQFDRMEEKLSPNVMESLLSLKVHPYLLGRAKRRFSNQGDDAVGTWKPLRESTKAIRKSKGFAEGPINVRTGSMMEALTRGTGIPDVKQVGAGTVLLFPGASALDALQKKKFEVAQKGLKSPRTPPRPILALGESDYAFIIKAIDSHLEVR